MKFQLFRRSRDTRSRVHLSPNAPENKGDSLDKSITDIAIQLINGQGGLEFRGYFIDLFRHEPRFIKDVLPEYREALQRVLDHD